MQEEYVLYCYDLSSLKYSAKVRFVYLLRGRRGEKGMVQALKGRFIAQGCFIIPIKNNNEMDEIMKEWGVKHKTYKIKFLQ